MSRPSLARRLLAAFLAIALLAMSAGFTWAVADDYATREVVPAGVRIGEIDLGGMTSAEARFVMEQEVAAPLLAPMTVTTPNGDVELPAAEMLSVDIDGMVASALQPKRDVSLPERVYLRLSGEPVETEVRTVLAVDEEKLAAWTEATAADVDRPAIDATLTVGDGELSFIPHKVGYKTQQESANTQLAEALTSGLKVADLPVDELAPAVTDDSWGKSILVDLSQRRLWLYDGTELEITYRVAVGTSGHPTPTGNWKIVNKRYMPSWSNPAPNGWGAGMPAYIPPGSRNPLGTRALDLNASGIRIHGTSNRGSIGSAASHGCMRMLRENVEDLYPRVPIGTRVIIVR